MLSALTMSCATSQETEKREGAKGEEVFKYKFKWTVLPAAYAEMRVREEVVDGRRVRVIEASARSSGLVDPFWKMRDSAKATFDIDAKRSTGYELHQKENFNYIDTVVTFDHELKAAKTEWKKRKGKKHWEKSVEVPFSEAYDPLSAAMLLREMNYEEGKEVWMDVIEGKSLYRVHIEKVATEPVKMKKGKIEAHKLKIWADKAYPAGGEGKEDEEKVRSVFAWVSKEERPRLLRLEAEAFVGRVSAELVE